MARAELRDAAQAQRVAADDGEMLPAWDEET